MQLIVVQRSKMATFALLSQKFSDDPDVRVIWDRRATLTDAGDRPSRERRLRKAFNSQGYLVVHTVDDESAYQRRPKN
jgi:hypothetical protein